jgi:hypothetical protein
MQTIRELGPDDVEAFREIRLEALCLHPDAFGSVHAVEVQATLADFAAKIARGGLFGGFVDGRLEGIAGFSVPSAAQPQRNFGRDVCARGPSGQRFG